MDPISILLAPYTLSGLLTAAIAIFGIQTILIATVAFLGLAGYFSAVPFMGVLGNTSPRVVVFAFIQELVYLVSSLLLLLLALSSLTSFVLLLALYLPVVIAGGVNVKRLPKLQSYESMVSIRTAEFLNSLLRSPLETPLMGIAMVWIVLTLEWTVLFEFNPIMPLVAWLLLIYTYLMTLLQAAHSHGVIFQVTHSPFVKVFTRDQKEYDGFVVGRGSDHYVLTTSSGNVVIQSDYVERLVEQEVAAKKPLAEPKA